MELFAYNSLHPKENELLYIKNEEALYKQFKASEALKELEKDLGDETENKAENTPISMPEDEIIDEKLWLEFPISSISIKLENANNEAENTQKYIFHSKSKLNRKNNIDSNHKFEYPKWFYIQNDPKKIAFYGIGSYIYPNSNLASIYLESVIKALKVNAEYLKTEVKTRQTDYPETRVYNRNIRSSFDEILKKNMMILTDFNRQFSNKQNLFIKLMSDKNRAEMQKIREEEKLYKKFKAQKEFEK